MACLNCGKPTDNPKFCSRSCSAIFTNKASPKRPREGRCFSCGIPLQTRYKRCQSCHAKHRSMKNKTIGDYRKLRGLQGEHPSWVHAHIRGMARIQHKNLITEPCAVCGYSKHVEIAHIKPLSSFSDDTSIEVVNARNNVIQLCRNCHWEFDNGLIQLAPLEGVEPSTLRVETACSVH